MKLCQILAVEKGVRGRYEKALTDAHVRELKPGRITGLRRTYEKLNDADPDLPGEATKVQTSVKAVLTEVTSTLSNLFDVIATKDWANTEVKADLVIDGQLLIPDVPVSHLLFVEKTCVNLDTFLRGLPTLPVEDDWTWDDNAGVYASTPKKTARTKKVMRNHVKAKATEKHAEQVDVYSEDVVVGYWNTVNYSGAIPVTRRNQLLDRVRILAAAAKQARELANTADITQQRVGETITNFVFA